jgi:hypothetical protein
MVPFFSASGATLSREVADSKINVQSACAQDTRFMAIYTFSTLQ